jgi:Fe2+ transport system protein FeoA
MESLALSEIGVKEAVEVISVASEVLALKLVAMGCTPGGRVYIERKARSGDPILIRTEGSLISIRKADACQVKVKKAI